MQMQDVTSSNIAAIGYDEDEFKLRVRFNNGRTYEYENVPCHVFAALNQASSVGQTFNATVKNQYPTQEV